MAIKILLVDDHAMFRAGIRVYLQMDENIKVVGEAGSGKEALEKIKELHPDIVIMDISMTGMDGLSTTRIAKENNPNIKVILLTQHENREYIHSALKMGADGFVVKRAAADELIKGIKQVYEGKSFLDSFITDVIVQDYRDKRDITNEGAYESLTEREREVLLYLTKGCTNKEIADILCISIKTVDYHRANIMRKLGINNRVELTKYAMQKGLI